MSSKLNWKMAGCLAIACFMASACDSSQSGPSGGTPVSPTTDWHKWPIPSPSLSPSPKPSPSSTPSPTLTSAGPVALVFNGTGTSASDEQSLVSILQAHGISEQEVTSAQLEALTATDLAKFKLIVWPGGDSTIQSENLDANTRERVREAVVNSGVNFAGFCAGAFIAVGPAPANGSTPAWGLAIVNYNYVTEYLPNGAGNTQPVAAMVMASFANGTQRDLVWWDGPFLPSITGGVIARYPNGTSAMIEVQSGNGFVVLSGVHPEAPQSWRDEESLIDADGLDLDIAWNLINSSLTRGRLPTF